MTVEHIAERLNDRFNLLTQGSRAALPRQQTLRATIDWSYDLLPDDARTLFRRLSVFAGGFTLDAAEAVCADPSPVSPAPTGQGTGRIGSALVLDELARLVDRSLVLVEQRGESERYRMLETIREYAAEKLRQAGEDRSVRNRHLAFFLDLSEQAEPNLEQGQPHVLLDRLETELDNVRAAVEWALEDAQPVAALRLVAALRRFWMPLSAHRSEGVERLTEILARPDAKTPTRARLKALNAYLFLLWPTRELTGAQAFLEEALALAAKLGDRRNLARALWLSAVGAIERGDSMLARSSLQQSIELYHELGDERGMAMSLSLLGDVAMLQGDYAHAEASYEEAIPRLREARDFTFLAMPLRRLGQLAMYHGDKARSARLIKESLISNWSVHDYVGVGGCLAAFAALSMAQGQNERAVKLLRAVDALLEYIHFPLLPFDQQQYERTVSELRAHMNEAVFAKAWAEGRTLTLEQAVELALATASDAAR